MKGILLFAGILVMAIATSAQETQVANEEQAVLIAINRQFIKNFLNNDTVAHTRLIHADFLFIGKNGQLHNRSEYMQAWAHGYDKAKIPEFELEEVQIRMFGNTALIIAKTRDKTMRNGKWSIGETRYTDTYVKENGQWKCVQVQLTAMPSAQD